MSGFESFKPKTCATEAGPAPDYLKGHKASGIKVGDRVKVVRRAADLEGGWVNGWDHDHMDAAIGREFKIERDCGSLGFSIDVGDDWYDFPYFVLEKVEPEPWKPKAGEECWQRFSDNDGRKVFVRGLYGSWAWVATDQDPGRRGVLLNRGDLRPLPPKPPVEIGDVVHVICKRNYERYGLVCLIDPDNCTFQLFPNSTQDPVFDWRKVTITKLVPEAKP